jgi:hypothetical protein
MKNIEDAGNHDRWHHNLDLPDLADCFFICVSDCGRPYQTEQPVHSGDLCLE